MNKTNKQHKALKKSKNNGFFKALIFGFVSCAAVWITLALVFSAFMLKQTDSTALVRVLSPVTVVASLVTGGFVAGKTDKSCAPLSGLVLGCAVLGVCYCISVSLELSMELSTALKTVLIAVMLVCPVIGAKISARDGKRKRHSRG